MSIKHYLLAAISILFIITLISCKKEGLLTIKKTSMEESYYEPIQPVKYLALGDSYTKAQGELPENSFPTQLVNRFTQNNIDVNGKLVIAETGWRTDNLKNAILAANLKDTFNLVSLLIGVNNQYQGKSPSLYRIEFRALAEMAIQFAGGDTQRVFVLSIPDYGATPFGSSNEVYIGQQIDLFNSINKEVSDSLNIPYFDITPISRMAKTDATLLCGDNLHPSGKMYGQWIDLFFPEVSKRVIQP